jgi:RNA polymerase sigma-70 factor, ECF subfamily
LIQTAMAIAASATLAHDLADSLYSDVYGLNEKDGKRKSPLESYSGRGPLIGWLRTALVQKHANHQRRVRREVPLGTQDISGPAVFEGSASLVIEHVQRALVGTLGTLSANDRFLLVSYFLDGRTLAQIGQLLRVHEATASRKLKRLTKTLRKRLIQQLHTMGLSKRAAEEAIGVDPRDLSIDVRNLLQSMPVKAFKDQEPSSEQSL